MKKTLVVVVMICVVCIGIVSIGAGIAYAVTGENPFYTAGQLLRISKGQQGADQGKVLARYNGKVITRSNVDYMKNLNILRSEAAIEQYATDQAAVDSIIKEMILEEEAKARGLWATQQEVEAMMESIQYAYTLPDGKEMMDDYLAGAGLSWEEYLKIVREGIPSSISRQKLLDEIGREFCQENGIEYQKNNPPAAMVTAQEEYIQALFQQNQSKIEYFLDVVS